MQHLIKSAKLSYCSYDNDPSSFGFVYQDNDSIYITYKGLSSIDMAFKCINVMPSIYDNNSYIHGGYLECYNSIKDIIHDILQDLEKICINENKYLVFTGHSLGGVLASLSAYEYAKRDYIKKDMVKCITFGSPGIGNSDFISLFKNTVPNNYRVTLSKDFVPQIPFYNHTHNNIHFDNDDDTKEFSISKYDDINDINDKEFEKIIDNRKNVLLQKNINFKKHFRNIIYYHSMDSYIFNLRNNYYKIIKL